MKKLLNRIFGRLHPKQKVVPIFYPYKVEFVRQLSDNSRSNGWVKSRTRTIRIHIGDTEDIGSEAIKSVVICMTPEKRDDATLLGTFNGVNIYKE